MDERAAATAAGPGHEAEVGGTGDTRQVEDRVRSGRVQPVLQKQGTCRPLRTMTTDPGADDLPAVGRPAPAPRLPKVAIEEHFNYLTAKPGHDANVDLARLVKAMDYDVDWSARVAERLADVDRH